jgi:hypothetical protein
MMILRVNAHELEKQARYLRSVACLVKDAEKHDEIQREAQSLFAKAQKQRTETPLQGERQIIILRYNDI